jgi:hypothetical protein
MERGPGAARATANQRVPRRALLQAATLAVFGAALVVPWISSAHSRGSAGEPDDCLETRFELRAVEYRLDPGLPAGGALSEEPVDGFAYLVSPDDVGQPADQDPLKRPALHALESTESAIVASGVAAPGSNVVPLSLCPGRYLVTVEAAGHTAWGQHVRVTEEGAQGRFDRSSRERITVGLVAQPTRLASVVVRAFEDRYPVNGVPDDPSETQPAGDTGLAGFEVRVRDAAGRIVLRDAWGHPLCTRYESDPDGSQRLDADGRPVAVPGTGGSCATGTDGSAVVDNLAPGSYDVEVVPPAGACPSAADGTCGESTRWLPTGEVVREARVGAPLSAEGPAEVPPSVHWLGFVRAAARRGAPYTYPGVASGTGRVGGCVKTMVGHPPFDGAAVEDREPVVDGWIALNDLGRLEPRTAVVAPLVDDPDCPGGRIELTGVPAGRYRAFIWDTRLAYVGRELSLPRLVDGGAIEVPSDDPRPRFRATGLFRRFGWISGSVYQDDGVAADGRLLGRGAGNGVRDCRGIRMETGLAADVKQCERPLEGVPVRLRARDGAVLDSTVTGIDGFYAFPRALSELERFEVLEVGAGDYQATGPSSHDPYDWTLVTRLASHDGRNASLSQLTAAGRRAWVDWGMRPYVGRRAGRIEGAVYYDEQRSSPAAEVAGGAEPGVPGVEVRLWKVVGNPDTCAGTRTSRPDCDDLLVNVYGETDHWTHPNRGERDPNGPCDVLDAAGNPVVWPRVPTAPRTGADVAGLCSELPLIGAETKDGSFDGAYVFEDFCSGGYSETARTCARGSRRAPLAAGEYVVEAVLPDPWQIVREEDVNVLGDAPKASPPAARSCVGRPHVVDVRGSGSDGYTARADAPASVPVDNEMLAARGSPEEGQVLPLCDRKLVTLEEGASGHADFFAFPLAAGAAGARPVRLPARIFGRLGDAVGVDGDQKSILFGRPRAAAGVPVGIRDRSYRLLTTVVTDDLGYYEALVPAGADCATAEACASRYLVVVNDPGPEVHGLSGTVRTAGGSTALTGAGTSFLVEVAPGDRIQVGPDTRVVRAVLGSARLEVSEPWRTAVKGATASLVVPSPDFDPGIRVEQLEVSVQPGRTALLDTLVQPVSGGICLAAPGPELYTVHHAEVSRARPDLGPVFGAGRRRALVLRGSGFGEDRGGSTVSLTSAAGRSFTIPATAFDTHFGGGDGWADGEIRLTLPASIAPGPYQLLVTTALSKDAPGLGLQETSTTTTGITVHLLGPGYDPAVRLVDGSRRATGDGGVFPTVQEAIESVPIQRGGPAPVIVVAPGTYRENVLLSRRVKLQGFGPGAPAEAGRPEGEPDPALAGSVLAGRLGIFDPSLRGAWQTRLRSAVGTRVTVPAGAAVTVLARGNELVPPDFSSASGIASGRAQIDGFAVREGVGDGAGGVFAATRARWLEISNNVFEGNQGALGGAIVLGVPGRGSDARNTDVLVTHNRIVGNGGGAAGGVAVHGGSDGYTLSFNLLCGNASAAGGGGLAHRGRSVGTASHRASTVADNRFVSNEAAQSGGAVEISGLAEGTPGGVEGSGPVDVLRNELSANVAGENGGALVVRATRPGAPGGCGSNGSEGVCRDRIRIVNDSLANNSAARAGGAVSLEGAPNVQLVNNTIARNLTTASCPSCDAGEPLGAGLTSDPTPAEIQALLPAGAPEHSNPILLNNLFFRNEALTVDRTSPLDPEVVTHGVVDLQVIGIAGTLCAVASALSEPYPASGTCGSEGSQAVLVVGDGDPFVRGSASSLEVGLGPLRRVTVRTAGLELPSGTDTAGDYHLCDPRIVRLQHGPRCVSRSVIDAGEVTSDFRRPWGVLSVDAPENDIDRGARASSSSSRSLGAIQRPDLGADELEERKTVGRRVSGRRAAAPPSTAPRPGPAAPAQPGPEATDSEAPTIEPGGDSMDEEPLPPDSPTQEATSDVAPADVAPADDAPAPAPVGPGRSPPFLPE